MATDSGFVLTDEQAEEEASTRRMDPELRVLGQIMRQLADVGPDAAKRIMQYLGARYAS